MKCREQEFIFPEIAVLLKPLRLVSEVQQGNQNTVSLKAGELLFLFYRS
jgi:hypothetical protein